MSHDSSGPFFDKRVGIGREFGEGVFVSAFEEVDAGLPGMSPHPVFEAHGNSFFLRNASNAFGKAEIAFGFFDGKHTDSEECFTAFDGEPVWIATAGIEQGVCCILYLFVGSGDDASFKFEGREF